MIISFKDVSKLVGIAIITLCAVFVCTMFLNYYFDVQEIKVLITSEQELVFYNAQVSTAKLVCLITGGCLMLTSIIMLLFYIKQYIDTHKKELGILKALGYSNLKIAKNFWIFGLSVMVGALIGFFGSFIIMPSFYDLQNADNIIPNVSIHFYPSLLIYLILIPTVSFSLIAIYYAYRKLHQPVLILLKDYLFYPSKVKKARNNKSNDDSFIADLRNTNIRSKKTLAFFIIFSSFCFSSMTQMSMSMKELSSVMMGVMIMIIGLVLASVTLFLSIVTVINGNKKTIAMMRVMGYSSKECSSALLNGYRPIAYIGFIIGTIYQYMLIRLMIDIVFKDFEGLPSYQFNFVVMIISLIVFIVLYEILMYVYSNKINRVSLKTIMIE